MGGAPDRRHDEVFTSRHCRDAIGAGRVGGGAPSVREVAAPASQPRFDLHVYHRLAAMVGDDPADGATPKELDRRVGKCLTTRERDPHLVALRPAPADGAGLIAVSMRLDAELADRKVAEGEVGAKNLPKARYVHSIDEVVEGLTKQDTIGEGATGQEFPLTTLVMPATIQHIETVSEQNERMPAKSTYVYPKLLSGMVFNLLSPP